MHFSTSSILFYLFASAATSNAWSMIGWDQGNCNPDGAGYRIIDGDPNDGSCHRFRSGEGPHCSQYWDSGAQGPIDCDNSPNGFGSVSAAGNCKTYTGQNCDGQGIAGPATGKGCINAGDFNPGVLFRSFICQN
jgi:hypothetical protein